VAGVSDIFAARRAQEERSPGAVPGRRRCPAASSRTATDVSHAINGAPALDWVAVAVAELAGYPDMLHLQRTTAFGHYDDGFALPVTGYSV